MRVFLALSLLAIAGAAQSAYAGCTLVRTQGKTPGCYGYVGYSNGVRVGWFSHAGAWVIAGSGARCTKAGYPATQIAKDTVRLSDGAKIKLDPTCDHRVN